MTNHVARLYAGALALLVFFLVWAVVAARPWAAAGRDRPARGRARSPGAPLARESRSA